MLLTEEQARTKWCPHVRHAVVTSRDLPASATANRENGEHYGCGPTDCISAECMAWNWTDQRGPGPITTQAGPVEAVTGHRWYAAGDGSDLWGLFPLLGCCGLSSRAGG